uniref:MYND-type domain-containing protein n=1 Tax=Panagrolaimus davidi TaxID=227884 RepID=A0A914Q6Y4_9BILA
MDEILHDDNHDMNDDISGIQVDDRLKKTMFDLEQHWLAEYMDARERLLSTLTEKMHAEFLSDQTKIRNELLAQFKDELESTKKDLEKKYEDQLKSEVTKVVERHKRETSQAKKKQWCWQCESEAIYHCCWNTAYCSVECQQSHWNSHRKFCRRRNKDGNNGPGPAGAPLNQQ